MSEETNYCKNCVSPISSVFMSFDTNNVCSACDFHKSYQSISEEEWKNRRKKFEKILNENKSNSNYDCIVPVSGGKDSYFQTHQIVKEFKLKPLLVTYDGNNYLPEGIENRDRVVKEMTVSQIEKAQDLARQCVSNNYKGC